MQTYLHANAQRIERIEDRLETLIENQQAALSELQDHPPGFFASGKAKAAWSAELGAAQDRLQTLNARLSRLEELKEQTAELVFLGTGSSASAVHPRWLWKTARASRWRSSPRLSWERTRRRCPPSSR